MTATPATPAGVARGNLVRDLRSLARDYSLEAHEHDSLADADALEHAAHLIRLVGVFVHEGTYGLELGRIWIDASRTYLERIIAKRVDA